MELLLEVRDPPIRVRVAASLIRAAAEQLAQGLDLRPEVRLLLFDRREADVQLLYLRLGRLQPGLRAAAAFDLTQVACTDHNSYINT